MNTAFVFPGQGSQSIGMMAELASQFSSVREDFAQASDAIGVDLWQLTQSGDIAELSRTENTQPALLTAGVAAWHVWKAAGGDDPQMMAGHSLGEYTALCCAGAIEFSQAVELVRDRGRYMQQAVPEGAGAMAAILGLDDENIIQVCEETTGDEIVQAVNFNAPGQVVIAGHVGAVERTLEKLKAAGARRAIILPVSIPAHSSLMQAAVDQLKNRVESITIESPKIPVVHNVNASTAKSVEELRSNLVAQLDSPVRWVDSINYMHGSGIDCFVESGPGRVLGGMIKRIAKDAQNHCLEKPDALQQLLSEQA